MGRRRGRGADLEAARRRHGPERLRQPGGRGMKPEDIRRELDRGPNLILVRPKADTDQAGGGADLAHAWADDITPSLDRPGLVDRLLGTTGLSGLYGDNG